jgi:hypothetical protein
MMPFFLSIVRLYKVLKLLILQGGVAGSFARRVRKNFNQRKERFGGGVRFLPRPLKLRMFTAFQERLRDDSVRHAVDSSWSSPTWQPVNWWN